MNLPVEASYHAGEVSFVIVAYHNIAYLIIFTNNVFHY
jgi:hypothetical protein